MVARGYFIPGRTSQRGGVGHRRYLSHVVRPRLEQTSGITHRDGFRQPYSSFSNRPHPLAQNRGTILMGIVLWRVTENPKFMILGFGQNPTFKKNVMISTSGTAAEMLDGTDARREKVAWKELRFPQNVCARGPK